MRRILSAAALMFLAVPLLSAQAAPATPGERTARAPAQQPTQAQQPAPAKPAKHMSTMATEAQIREAQTALNHSGLYKGAVTGTMNKDFEAALRKYQTDHKLKATGHVDEATLAALRKA